MEKKLYIEIINLVPNFVAFAWISSNCNKIWYKISYFYIDFFHSIPL